MIVRRFLVRCRAGLVVGLISTCLATGCTWFRAKDARQPSASLSPPIIEPQPAPAPSAPYVSTELPPSPNPLRDAAALRGAPPPPPVPAGTMRVALLLPLTGRLAALGQSMLRSSQMALFDLADASFELLPYDTKGDAEGAEQAAKLALLDGASLVLGPLLASSARAVAPLVAAANVPMVTFSSDSRLAGVGTYVMGFAPELEVQRIIDYATANGVQRIAVLAPDGATGAAVVAAAQVSASARGASISAIELYNPKARDFSSAVSKLARNARSHQSSSRSAGGTDRGIGAPIGSAVAADTTRAPIDAVLIADGGDRLRAVAAHLPAAGLVPPAVRLLGTGAWDETDLGSEPALIGGWFAAPVPRFRREFERTYQESFGAAPARLSTLSYDATAIAIVIAREHSRGLSVTDVISDQSGFVGRDGLFRFTASGLAERRLGVLEIQRQGVVVVSEPSVSFAGS